MSQGKVAAVSERRWTRIGICEKHGWHWTLPDDNEKCPEDYSAAYDDGDVCPVTVYVPAALLEQAREEQLTVEEADALSEYVENAIFQRPGISMSKLPAFDAAKAKLRSLAPGAVAAGAGEGDG